MRFEHFERCDGTVRGAGHDPDGVTAVGGRVVPAEGRVAWEPACSAGAVALGVSGSSDFFDL
jgi:hypothetical protein